MDVAIVTVGDELLAGETENTNATLLARRIADRGGSVEVILTIGDDLETISRYVSRFHEGFDRVVVTGGLGGTHDDVTMAAVADALDRDLVVEPAIRESVEAASREFVEANPDLAERYDLGLDVDAWSETVAGGTPLENPEGLSPGCIVEDVYVFPGVPSELEAMFETVIEDFEGDRVSLERFTDAPEGVLQRQLTELEATFDVQAGSYPGERTDRNRVRVVGSDLETVTDAADWLGDRIELRDS